MTDEPKGLNLGDQHHSGRLKRRTGGSVQALLQPLLGFEHREEKQEDEREAENKERKTPSRLPGSAVHGRAGAGWTMKTSHATWSSGKDVICQPL